MSATTPTTAQTAAKAAQRAIEERAAARAAAAAALPLEKRIALELVRELYMSWAAPVEGLSRAGAAFEGLEQLLGGADFSLTVGWGRRSTVVWKRRGARCSRFVDRANVMKHLPVGDS